MEMGDCLGCGNPRVEGSGNDPDYCWMCVEMAVPPEQRPPMTRGRAYEIVRRARTCGWLTEAEYRQRVDELNMQFPESRERILRTQELAAEIREQINADVARRLANHPRRSATGTPTISDVGRRDDGTLACPKCGGTQFKARRSGAARAGIITSGVVTMGIAAPVVGAAVTRKNTVECVTCGAKYRRG